MTCLSYPAAARKTGCQCRRIIFTFLMVCLGFMALCGPVSLQAATKPVLQGTFLQLWNDHGTWSAKKWSQLFSYLKQANITQLVVQWTVCDQTAFFPCPGYQTFARPPLETILRLADENGMTVLLGLSYDSAYWNQIEVRNDSVATYLNYLYSRSTGVAQALAPLAQQHPSFQGWYITEEVDDLNWVELSRRQLLFNYLRDLTLSLQRLTPGARVAVSGFVNGQYTTPETLGNFWKDLLAEVPLDLVLFQDGIGVQKLTLGQLPLYLAEVKEAAFTFSRDLQVIVELFRQISEDPFEAVPAPWSRVKSQITAANSYSTCGIMSFSVPEYMTPMGLPGAKKLFNNYLKYLASIKK